jgi:hypothetical protein
MGRQFIIPVISAISVTRSPCVSCEDPILCNIPSRMRRIVPICRSHTPPKCDAWGGLKIAILFGDVFLDILKVGFL